MTRARRGSAEALRRFALALPGAIETITWGSPHFRVGGKIFGGLGTRDGRHVTSAKLEKPHAEALLLDPRFRPAPYVGRYGWVEFALEDVTPAELEQLVSESHRLVAKEKPVAENSAKSRSKPKPKRKSKPKSKSKSAAEVRWSAPKPRTRANSRIVRTGARTARKK